MLCCLKQIIFLVHLNLLIRGLFFLLFHLIELLFGRVFARVWEAQLRLCVSNCLLTMFNSIVFAVPGSIRGSYFVKNTNSDAWIGLVLRKSTEQLMFVFRHFGSADEE